MAAALVLLALSVGWQTQPAQGRTAFSVTLDGDVEIISMDAGDVPALIVGEPPVRGPLMLASAQDVTVDDTGHDVEVVVPDPDLPSQRTAPMMMVPLDTAP